MMPEMISLSWFQFQVSHNTSSHETGSEEESHEESSAGAETVDSRDVIAETASIESFFTRQRPVYTSPVFPSDADAYNEDKVRLI